MNKIFEELDRIKKSREASDLIYRKDVENFIRSLYKGDRVDTEKVNGNRASISDIHFYGSIPIDTGGQEYEEDIVFVNVLSIENNEIILTNLLNISDNDAYPLRILSSYELTKLLKKIKQVLREPII